MGLVARQVGRNLYLSSAGVFHEVHWFRVLHFCPRKRAPPRSCRLRTGGNSIGIVDLLPAWKAHGEVPFSYEILEHVEEDNPHKLELLLTQRTAYWLEKLGAKAIRKR
jgi:hypothetical protein